MYGRGILGACQTYGSKKTGILKPKKCLKSLVFFVDGWNGICYNLSIQFGKLVCVKKERSFYGQTQTLSHTFGLSNAVF